MNIRRFTLIGSLVSFASTAAAVQQVEAGLQPLEKRIADIHLKMRPLDLQLKASETLPVDRAAAYRRYELLDAEQRNLLQDIQQAKQWAKSPLVNYLGSAYRVRPSTGLTPLSSRQPSAAAHVER